MNTVQKCTICNHEHDEHFRHVGIAEMVEGYRIKRHRIVICERCYEMNKQTDEDDDIIFVVFGGLKYIFN